MKVLTHVSEIEQTSIILNHPRTLNHNVEIYTYACKAL